jgi:hypothetical protein
MNGMDELDAVSEDTLRGALRLESGERPPRLDAAALAAAAQQRTPLEQMQRAVRGIALIGVSLGIELTVALVAINTLADLDLTGPVGLALPVVVAIAQRVVVIGQLTTAPSVAVAALAAVLFAIVHERGTGRESQIVRAS